MRFIHFYLIAYFVLVLGAGLALWQAGVLGRLPLLTIAVAAVMVIGLGLLLAVTADRPRLRA